MSIVQEGAILKSPSDGAGNGGRIMLAGANVINRGTISTEAGQTVLAGGLQVGIAAHDGNDPSLRGLDVWVGDVGDYGGTVENHGIIESLQGSISLTGKNIRQNGALESSTSVSLNGRIDIRASYGAVSNPNFDSNSAAGAGGPIFLNQFTGTVDFGENSRHPHPAGLRSARRKCPAPGSRSARRSTSRDWLFISEKIHPPSPPTRWSRFAPVHGPTAM